MQAVLFRTRSASAPVQTGLISGSSRSTFDRSVNAKASTKSRNCVSGGGGDRSSGRKIGVYYEQMLKTNPSDSLLLTNYAKYLHQVEGDMEKAEKYYGRAILASPDDGEVLSLYGKLIWDKEKDELRAKSYFNQAVHASPHDCMVLASYAQFMWESEEDEDEDEDDGIVGAVKGPAMVKAY